MRGKGKNRLILVHVSDLHFVVETLRLLDLVKTDGWLSKRFMGWINYKLNRESNFPAELRNRLINSLLESDWDYLVISGDLTTLSLEEEFIEARKCLEPLFNKGRVIITAGNHDRYIPTVLNPDLLIKYFADGFICSQQPQPFGSSCCLKLNDDVVLVEIDMAIPRRLFSSRGKIRQDLEKCGEVLLQEYEGYLKIAVGHYPAFLPPGQHENYLHALAGREKLRQFLKDSQIDLYLHGHIHKSWEFKAEINSHTVNINSGGCCRNIKDKWAGFHRITIEDNCFSVERVTC